MQCLSPSSESRGFASPSPTTSAQGMSDAANTWSTSLPRPRRSFAAFSSPRTTTCSERQAFGRSTCSGRRALQTVAATMNATSPSSQQRTFPAFIPREVEDIQEQVALDMAARMERVPVNVPCMGREVNTAFVGPATSPNPGASMTSASTQSHTAVNVFAKDKLWIWRWTQEILCCLTR